MRGPVLSQALASSHLSTARRATLSAGGRWRARVAGQVMEALGLSEDWAAAMAWPINTGTEWCRCLLAPPLPPPPPLALLLPPRPMPRL